MATRRSALGRGLGALIPGPEAAPAAAHAAEARTAPDAAGDAQLELPVESIAPNPEQPRRIFDAEALESLTDSIRRHGVLQPIVVREAGDGRYEIVVGERRWRATRAAGLASVPAVVADVASRDRLELALVENVQRRDLNPIELALAFRALCDVGHTQDEVGERVGLDRSTVSNHLRLLELPREFQEDVENGRVSMGHAKALLGVTNPERRRFLRDRVVGESLSVRQTESLARQVAGPSRRKRRAVPAAADPDLERVIDLLRDRLKTRVRIQGSAQRGRIEIEYIGGEDLNRVLGLILD